MLCPKCGNQANIKTEPYSAWGLHKLGLVDPGLIAWGVCTGCGFTGKAGMYITNTKNIPKEERKPKEAQAIKTAIKNFEAGIDKDAKNPAFQQWIDAECKGVCKP